jgi:hypothetical protein
MKKLLVTCLILAITAFSFAGNIQYTYTFNAPSVKLSGDFQSITFDNTYLTGMAGQPALPYQAVKLLLPPGEEAVSVTLSYENEEAVPGTFTLYPQQPSQPYSKEADGIFYRDMEVYASSATYPADALGHYSTHFLNGHGFLLASFTPLTYIPATGQVSYFHKIIINVETRATDRAARALENLNSSENVESLVKAVSQNVSMLESYPQKQVRDEEYQYLIITPQQFVEAFQPLAELYLKRGYKTHIETTESISATMPGQDVQDQIRNYIIMQYQNYGIEYVLLGGDVEHIPYRGFYCHVQSSSVYEDWNIPADLYYSSLDGNWNTDGDGEWAEIGEDDLLPDVAVTRLPFSSNSQLQKILHKTIMYQDQPVLGEMRDVLIAGENLWSDPLTYGEDYLELLIGWRNDNGYETDGIPEDYNFNKLYDSQMSWDGYTLMNAINQGSSFIHHSGHANQTYVMRLNISDIINSNFAQVNGINHNYALVYTHGCLCGAFDENDCIGEAMVLIDNFAVAGAFNSRYGWFNEGQTEGPSAHMHREFTDALYHDKEWHIGAAHMISKIETSVWVNAPGQWEEGALRWCFYDCNIFSDPLLGVWTEEPIGIATDFPEEIYPGETVVPVSVTSNGLPVAGLNCVIMAGQEMLGCGTTGENGEAEVSILGSFEGFEEAQLIVSGYNCLPQEYDLNIVVGIDEKESISGIQAVPNPFNDKFVLVFKLEQARAVEMKFYGLTGQLIDQVNVEGKAGLNEIKVNTAGWPEGMILSKIISGNRVDYSPLLHIKK